MGLKEFGKRLFPDTTVEPDDIYGGNDEDYGTGVEDEAHPEVSPIQSYPGRSAKVTAVAGSSIEMKVVTPSSYDSVTQIADLLLSNKTVLLNLEKTNKETAKRLIDFLSGVAYALSGEVQKVADNTYAITPRNVAVSKETVGANGVDAVETGIDEEVSF